MTTYILHGGRTSFNTASNRAFYKLMADSLPAGGRWLGCYFARLSDTQMPIFKRDIKKLTQAAEGKNFHAELAEPRTFVQQLQQADVLYLGGGSTLGLLNALSEYPNIVQHIQQTKVVVGSSAGMNVLGRDFLGKNGFGKGLGILPYGMVVHHRAPDYAVIQNTIHMAPPSLMLHETQFCVIEH